MFLCFWPSSHCNKTYTSFWKPLTGTWQALTKTWQPLTGTVALSWLSGVCVPGTPRAMPAGVFTPLVGPPKPERSRSRVQTKDSPTAPQGWELGLRLTTLSCKRTHFLHADLPRPSNRMTTSGESQKETTGMKLKLEVMSAKGMEGARKQLGAGL